MSKLKKIILLVIAVVSVITMSFLVLGCKEEAAPVKGEAEETIAETDTTVEEPEEAEKSTEKVKLVAWIGGDWDQPGLFSAIEAIADNYKEIEPNVEIELVNVAVDTVLEQTESVVQAKSGPDIVFTWAGSWSIGFVWKGGLSFIDDFIPEDEYEHYIGVEQRMWEGKHYGVPYYIAGKPMLYNKELFKKAGLDPNEFPKKWDDFLDVCQKIKDAGITPIGMGVTDWFGGYFVGELAPQVMDSPLPILEMSVGETKNFTDEAYLAMWEKIYELYKLGYFNEDADSLNLWQAWEMFAKGDSAIAFQGDYQIPFISETIGAENIGVATIPAFGNSIQTDKYVLEVHGGSITSWSPNKQAAADFLMYIHDPKSMNILYEVAGILPPDDRFDFSVITNPALKDAMALINERGTAQWYENYMPIMVDELGNYAGAQKMFSGELDAKGMVEFVEDAAMRWRESNPDELSNFKKWAESYK